MLQLDALAAFLADLFELADFQDDVAGIYLPSDRPITRFGLALEPWPALGQWAQAEDLDALFLHRPWSLEPGTLPPDVGVVASHRAFDERLTLGYNPDLAVALDLRDLVALGKKDGRWIGMMGTTPDQSFGAFEQRLLAVFGGLDQTEQGTHDRASRVAVVGAMTAALVREAADRGADVYVTGQWRQPARIAVMDTGISVVVVGHRRSEEWALQRLAQRVQNHWPALCVVLPPGVVRNADAAGGAPRPPGG